MTTSEIKRGVVIRNKLGLHARAATQFVQLASKFECDVFLRRKDQEVNGKSIMGVLMLGAAIGTELTIIARGCDAEDAAAALVNLVEDKFHEGE